MEAKNAELAFLLSGRIIHVLVDEEQAVERDQTLAVIDQSEYQARYEQAKAHLGNSINNLQILEMVLEVYKNTLPDEVGIDSEKVRVGEKSNGMRLWD
jgi:multidrug resistance efflux pump